MKKINTIGLALLINFNIYAQTNLDFEKWSGGEPQGWSSSNDITTLSGGSKTVFKETSNPGQGTTSIKLVTGSCPDCPTYPASVTWGIIDCKLPDPFGGSLYYGTVIEPGIPYTKRPLSIDFLYKSNPVGNDAGGFHLTLSRYNASKDESEVVGEAYFIADMQVNKWTQINVPVVYYSTQTPDTLNIDITSSIGTIMDCSNSMIFPNMPSPYNDWGLPYPETGSEFHIDAIVINLPSCSGLSLSVTGTNETGLGANDGTASATASGGTAPYTYSWSNLETTQNISGLIPGYYYVTVTDANQCQKTGSYSVAPTGCNLSVSISGTTSDQPSVFSGNGSATATASGGNPPYIFEWSTGKIETGVTTSSITSLPIGIYGVFVSEKNNPSCAMWAYHTVIIPGATAVKELNETIGSIYPNPASDILNVELFSSKNATYTLSDITGKTIISGALNLQRNTISLRELSQGTYFLKVNQGTESFVEKVTVIK